MDHSLGPRNEILFFPIVVFRRGISNASCGLVLYLLKEGLKISSKQNGVSWFQNLKTVALVQVSTLCSTGSQFILLKCMAEIWVRRERSKQYHIKRIVKRIAFVLSSPKGIDNLLSMNHSQRDENSLFKTFSIFCMSLCW